jgi:hypothetical protein
MTAARSVQAYFQLQLLGITPPPPPVANYTLAVGKAGSGAGSVSSNPAGINCGATCTASYASGTNVTLTATASPGSVFSGWSGACSGAGSCSVSMTGARSVTATFSPAGTLMQLQVVRAGTGSGSVSSSPPGINCGATCTATFAAGASVTLTALADAPSVFTGWSGACSGTSTTCVVSMTQARSVAATFSSPFAFGW